MWRTEGGGGERVLVAEELAEDLERVAEVERVARLALVHAEAGAAEEARERVDEERVLREERRVRAEAARRASAAGAHALVRVRLLDAAAGEALLPVAVVDLALLLCTRAHEQRSRSLVTVIRVV